MAKFKRVWIVRVTSPSDEDGYSVFLEQKNAVREAAEIASGFARDDAENLEWEEGVPESLEDIFRAMDENNYEDVLSSWSDYMFNQGGQNNVEIIEALIAG